MDLWDWWTPRQGIPRIRRENSNDSNDTRYCSSWLSQKTTTPPFSIHFPVIFWISGWNPHKNGFKSCLKYILCFLLTNIFYSGPYCTSFIAAWGCMVALKLNLHLGGYTKVCPGGIHTLPTRCWRSTPVRTQILPFTPSRKSLQTSTEFEPELEENIRGTAQKKQEI